MIVWDNRETGNAVVMVRPKTLPLDVYAGSDFQEKVSRDAFSIILIFSLNIIHTCSSNNRPTLLFSSFSTEHFNLGGARLFLANKC
jgi:hypothetical protein